MKKAVYGKPQILETEEDFNRLPETEKQFCILFWCAVDGSRYAVHTSGLQKITESEAQMQ